MSDPITLHSGQSKVIRHLFSPKTEENFEMQFVVLTASRGFGKSFVSGTAVALGVGELEKLDPSVPNKNIALICGSHTQVVDIFYPLLAYTMGLEARCLKSSRNLGRFWFQNGTEIRCFSADALDRMRGHGFYIVVADEATSWTIPSSNLKEAYNRVVEPTVLTRWSAKQAKLVGAPSPGRVLMPSTPNGKDHFYDLAMREIVDSRWKTFSFTYKDSPLLSEEEIEKARVHSDPIKFAREYLASFDESGVNVFYTFDRKKHVDPNLPWFEEGETVHAAIDFNILKNCTSFHAIRGGQLHCLDEMQGAYNTEELANAIKAKFPKKKVICYPDPTGVQRKSSAAVGVTDFTILRSAGFEVLSRSRSPAIVDSVAAVNRKLLNAKGDIDFYVHPRCSMVVNSLERTSWLENRPESAIIDKTQDVEHFSDGIRYIVEYLWPVDRAPALVIQSDVF